MAPLKAPSLTLLRAFSSTSRSRANPLAQRLCDRIPPYPYPALHFKQADRGLYGGSTIQFGNKVSERNEIKTRRSWHPNIHQKRLWSNALGRFVQVKVQARVLRTIDKVGGLDEYLLGEKPARIKELGVQGWRLRWRIMRTDAVKERFRSERARLGLPEGGLVTKNAIAEDVKKAAVADESRVERATVGAVEDIEAYDDGRGGIIDVEGVTRAGEEPKPPSSLALAWKKIRERFFGR